eukprot:12993526-Ditylum_brightwellii.AAC.2
MENLGDYVTKHHATVHHIKICPLYLHTPTSLRFLPCALAPSVLRGCVDPALAGRRPIWAQDRTLARTRTPSAHAYTVYEHATHLCRPAMLVQSPGPVPSQTPTAHMYTVPWAVHSVSRSGTQDVTI